MNCLKKAIEIIGSLLMLIGFFFLVGTAGASDYADEVGEVFSYARHLPFIISGFGMCLGGLLMIKCLERQGWYEEGGDD